MAISNGYTYTPSGADCTITNYDPTTSSHGYDPVIPATLDGYNVIKCDDDSFRLKLLTSVTFNNIVELGTNSFSLNGTITINVNANLTTSAITYVQAPFYQCTTSTINIDNAVTSLGNYIFSFCGVYNITIPTGLTNIPNHFLSYNSISTITIPSNITNIGDYAFYNNSITSLSLDYDVNLESLCFAGNTNLQLTLNADITTSGISSYLSAPFKDCAISDGLTIESSCTSLGNYVLSSCGLTIAELTATLDTMGNQCLSYNADLDKVYAYNETMTIGSSLLSNSKSALDPGTVYSYSGSDIETYVNGISNYDFAGIGNYLQISNTNYQLDIFSYSETHELALNERQTIINPTDLQAQSSVIVCNGFRKMRFTITGVCSISVYNTFVTNMQAGTLIYPIIFVDTNLFLDGTEGYYFTDISKDHKVANSLCWYTFNFIKA